MDCREFRDKHVGYVDDTLPAVEMEVMHRHVATCPRCARHDFAVRRGLLLVRNIPQIEPSADFMAKLNNRLAELQATAGRFDDLPSPHTLTTGSFAALAAALTLIAYLTIAASSRFTAPQTLTLPPVVATVPARPTSSVSPTAYMAAISTGMPVWPAVLMVDEAPRQLADVELQQAALR